MPGVACFTCDGRGKVSKRVPRIGLVESADFCGICRGSGDANNPTEKPKSNRRPFFPKKDKKSKEELSEAEMQKIVSKYMSENGLVRMA